MIVTLAGGPDSGKTKLAELIARETGGASISGLPALIGDAAVGSMADYRTELLIASYRAHLRKERVPVIQRTSLLDSMAYVMMRLAGMLDRQSTPDDETERWLLSLSVVTTLMRDSFESDLVFYLAPKTKEINSFAASVVAFLPDVLDGLEQDYITLDGDVTENAALVARRMTDAAALA